MVNDGPKRDNYDKMRGPKMGGKPGAFRKYKVLSAVIFGTMEKVGHCKRLHSAKVLNMQY